MRNSHKIIALSVLLLSCILFSYADRGLRKKSKNTVVLNIKTNPSFNSTLQYNLKNGLKYTGFLNYTPSKTNSIKTEYVNRTISSYKKGNTIYIIPKYRVVNADTRRGYTGVKFTINTRH